MTDKVQFRSDMTVELTDSMGGDESIVRFARVSSGSTGDEASDVGLIRYLMREKHGSPFESPILQFRIECPIFVAREFFRHRIASYNETSGRYRELEPVFYYPRPERKLRQLGKPGAYVFQDGSEDQKDTALEVHKEAAVQAWGMYKMMLNCNIAREVARNALPLSIYTSFYVNFNLRSLMNFFSLRMVHPDAKDETCPLDEIQLVAQKMDAFAREKVPVAMSAFDEFGRQCP